MFATDLKSPLLRRLDELACLQDGWDGEDSLAPTRQAVVGMSRLISSLSPQAGRLIQDPELSLNAHADGSLLLDFALPDGSLIAGAISHADAWSGYAFLPDGTLLDFAPTDDLESLLKLLSPIIDSERNLATVTSKARIGLNPKDVSSETISLDSLEASAARSIAKGEYMAMEEFCERARRLSELD